MPPIPSRKSVRRFMQVSLRMLIVLITLYAVGVGFLAKRARDQRAAVERIRQLGGYVAYDYQSDSSGKRMKGAKPPGWDWLRRLLGNEYFQDVVRVGCDKTKVSDDDLRLIARLPKLRTLALNWTGVTDAGLAHISELRRLEYLGLTQTNITDSGLKCVENLPALTDLILEGTAISDDGMIYLVGMSRLQTLALGDTSITSAGVPRLTRLKCLTLLSLRDTRVDDDAIEDLVAMSRLAHLNLQGTEISGQGLLEIHERLAGREIDSDACDFNSRPLGNYPRQRWEALMVRLRAVDAEGRLKLIDLSGTGLGDDMAAMLKGLKAVECIDLRDTRVTDAGLQQLQDSLPGCRVYR